MKQKRLLLCLLLSIIITFYGLSYLNFRGELTEVAFSVSWSMFALLSVSGNLVGLLFGGKVSPNKKGYSAQAQRQKIRHFG